MLLASSATFACVNLTGEYQTEEETYYSIEQTGCESMNVVDESGSSQMMFDGVERLTYDYDIEVEGTILAHVGIFLSGKINNTTWTYTEKDVITYADGQVEEDKKWAEVSFNEETDLQTILHNSDGTTETFVDIRNK